MFRIEMLPAAHGDSLWIEYGKGAEVSRILIDGGPAHTYPALRERILHLPKEQRHFELLVVTHIDADHIAGVVRLLQDAPVLGCRFDRIWFNGWEQLDAVPDRAKDALGAEQGEYLSLLVKDHRAVAGADVFNLDFPGAYVGIDRAAAALPKVGLPGGMKLTLLSPDHERLIALKDDWEDELGRAELEPGDEDGFRDRLEEARGLQAVGDVLGDEDEEEEGRYELPADDDSDSEVALPDELGGEAKPGSDGSSANGSSIALLAEYDGKRFLLAGDAWPSVLTASIDTLVGAGKTLDLTGYKVPHHGSVGNVSEELLSRIRCKHYLVSTSGAIFRHPHEACIKMLLAKHRHKAKPRLHFNYRTKTTDRWASQKHQKANGYEAFHPKGTSLMV